MTSNSEMIVTSVTVEDKEARIEGDSAAAIPNPIPPQD